MFRVIAVAVFLLVGLSLGQFTPRHRAAANGGGTIAYVRGGTEIRLIEADGSNDRKLWTHADAKKELGIFDVASGPHGARLLERSRGSNYSLYHSDLYAIHPDGTGFRKLTNPPDHAEFARYPKGSVSVTVRNDQPAYRQSQASAGIFIVYVAGADEPQQITLPPGFCEDTRFQERRGLRQHGPGGGRDVGQVSLVHVRPGRAGWTHGEGAGI